MVFIRQIILLLIIGCHFQTFAQDKAEKPLFPAYLDLSLGASVTSFSNLDGLFGMMNLNAGATINQNFAIGLDYMSGSSGTAHFIKRFSGLGLQGRYVKNRILGKITFGNILNTSVGGDLISSYRYADTFDFYGRIDIAYRFRKIWSVGISAYSSSTLTYDLYDYNNVSKRYDIFAGTSRQLINGIAVTIGMQLFPPYFKKS